MRSVRLALTWLLWPPVVLLGGLAAGAAVAAQCGRTSPKWDLLAHFAPFWLLGAAVALVAGLLFRGWWRALPVTLGLLGMAAAGALIVPEFVRSAGPRAPKAAAGQLKLVQFNVWHRNDQPQRLLDWLAAERPDIVVLEETFPALRSAIEARGDWRVACRQCEVMILSRATPRAVSGARRPDRSPGPLTRAVFRDAKGEFTVIGVHNAWPTDAADQQAQEQRLAKVIAASPRERTIVAGDFNSAPWSFSLRRWDRGFGLVRRERGLPTWPAMQYKRLPWLGLFPFLPIDHVYAGPAWATVSIRRGPRLGSDHFPMIVTLAPVAPR